MNMHCSVLAEAWKDLLSNHFQGETVKKAHPVRKPTPWHSMEIGSSMFATVCIVTLCLW